MALARIITQHPEDAAEVRDTLRRRGYWVEIVTPAEIPKSPAELEISLDRASFEQALAAARDAGAQIVVAPGVLPEPVPEINHPVSAPPEAPVLTETKSLVEEPPAESLVTAEEIGTQPVVGVQDIPAQPVAAEADIEAEPTDSFEAVTSRTIAWLASTGATLAGDLERATGSFSRHAGRLGRAAGRGTVAGAQFSQAWLRSQAPRMQKVAGALQRGAVLASGYAGRASVQLASVCVVAMKTAARQLRAGYAALKARHQERQAARRAARDVIQKSTPPVSARVSSDLVWQSRTTSPTISEQPSPVRARGGRQRDWEIALAGGALAASLLMLAFGLFGTQAQDVSAATATPKQKTVRISTA